MSTKSRPIHANGPGFPHPFKSATLCGKMVRFGGLETDSRPVTCKLCLKISAKTLVNPRSGDAEPCEGCDELRSALKKAHHALVGIPTRLGQEALEVSTNVLGAKFNEATCEWEYEK